MHPSWSSNNPRGKLYRARVPESQCLHKAVLLPPMDSWSVWHGLWSDWRCRGRVCQWSWGQNWNCWRVQNSWLPCRRSKVHISFLLQWEEIWPMHHVGRGWIHNPSIQLPCPQHNKENRWHQPFYLQWPFQAIVTRLRWRPTLRSQHYITLSNIAHMTGLAGLCPAEGEDPSAEVVTLDPDRNDCLYNEKKSALRPCKNNCKGGGQA